MMGGAHQKVLKKILRGTRITFDGRCSNGFLLYVIICHFLLAKYREKYWDNSNSGHVRFYYPK